VKDLQALRDALDAVDRKILDALAERLSLVQRVGELKQGGGKIVRDPAREEALLGRLVQLGRERGLEPFFVTRIFRELLDHSLRLQHERLAARPESGSLVVGFQGGEGAFSHMAASRAFAARGDVRFEGFGSFREMLEAVRDGDLDYALLPIENTTAGSINESYDLLAEMDLALVGEEVQPVEHCLIALEDIPLDRIRRVYSHPVALAQCRVFLGSLRDCHAEAYADTALSVRKVKEDRDLSQAAIASSEAARIHGLPILRRGVQDQKANFTRMVLVAREPERFDLRIPCKTSLIFSTRHEKGALSRVIAALATHGLNLTKLESRPRPNTPWEYRFYLDFEGNLGQPEVKEALALLAGETSYLRVLGSYPARTVDEAKPAAPRIPAKPQQPVPRDARVRLGELTIGDAPVVLLGPRILEAREDVTAAARAVQRASGRILFGGYVDARAKLGGEEVATLLAEASSEAGLLLALRVDHPADVAPLQAKADALVVAGAHAHDAALLRELGHADCPVVLTRGRTATLDEWLASADRIAQHGNRRVLLLDAGTRALGVGRRVLDLAALPELRERGSLALVDLAEASDAEAIARAAIAAGACGVVAPLSAAAELEGLS